MGTAGRWVVPRKAVGLLYVALCVVAVALTEQQPHHNSHHEGNDERPRDGSPVLLESGARDVFQQALVDAMRAGDGGASSSAPSPPPSSSSLPRFSLPPRPTAHEAADRAGGALPTSRSFGGSSAPLPEQQPRGFAEWLPDGST